MHGLGSQSIVPVTKQGKLLTQRGCVVRRQHQSGSVIRIERQALQRQLSRIRPFSPSSAGGSVEQLSRPTRLLAHPHRHRQHLAILTSDSGQTRVVQRSHFQATRAKDRYAPLADRRCRIQRDPSCNGQVRRLRFVEIRPANLQLSGGRHRWKRNHTRLRRIKRSAVAQQECPQSRRRAVSRDDRARPICPRAIAGRRVPFRRPASPARSPAPIRMPLRARSW